MRSRSVVLGSLVATAMLVVGQGTASANMVWCMSDPPAQVVTPGGANVMVNTTVYIPLGAQHLKGAVTQATTARPDGFGGTLIVVTIGLPAGVYRAEVVSSENRYQVSDLAYGSGGSTLKLYLDIPAA